MKLIHTNTNNIKKSLLYIFPIIAVATFTLVLTVIYNIYSISNSSAINPSTGTNVFTVSAGTSLGVSVADSTTLDIQPTSGGAFNSTPLTVYVETDNEYGYTLSMTTTTPDLKRTTPLSDGTIPTIETLASGSSFTSDTFTTNRWGYTLDNTNYYAIPGSIIINSAGTSGNYEDNPNVITFAAKLDNATPSGNYLTTINFIATAKTPADLSGFDAAFIFAGANKLTHDGESYYAMQDLTYSVCSYVATPSSSNIDSYPTVTVFDSRDYEKYTIGKLADGNCWLLDNLRLGGDSPIALTPTNTNIISNTELPASSVNNFTETSLNFTSPAININAANRIPTTFPDNYTTTQGTIGTVYNYCAASANTYCTNDNTESTTTLSYDICPTAWKIPLGGNTDDNAYAGLYTAYDSTPSLFVNALHTPLSGNFANGTLNDVNSRGVFWSSTLYESLNNYASVLFVGQSRIETNDAYIRTRGLSVRCVSRQTISDLTYMQDFARLTDTDKTDVINSMLPETAYTLKDKRDNQDYTIAKLKDGKVWMTKNLNLAGGTALYSDTSDVPSGYPSSASTPYYTLPDSSTTGFNDSTKAFVYNSDNATDNCADGCYSYYSWNAATAMSGTDITTDNTDAPYSICPAGWHLPTSRSTLELAEAESDFYQMAIHYGLNQTKLYEDNGSTFCTNAGDCPNSPTIPRFLRAGGYENSTFNGTISGQYWSSTTMNDSLIPSLGFSSGSIFSSYKYYRKNGFSVRCLLK